MSTLQATGKAATGNAARYIKQLVSHARHAGLPVNERDSGWLLALGESSIFLRSQEAGVHVTVEAPDADSLRDACDTISSHLEDFGRRTGLRVVWTPQVAGG